MHIKKSYTTWLGIPWNSFARLAEELILLHYLHGSHPRFIGATYRLKVRDKSLWPSTQVGTITTWMRASAEVEKREFMEKKCNIIAKKTMILRMFLYQHRRNTRQSPWNKKRKKNFVFRKVSRVKLAEAKSDRLIIFIINIVQFWTNQYV